MNKEIYFKDFDGLEHHHQFIDDQLEKTLGRLEGFRPFNVKVTIDEVNGKSSGVVMFGCEIIANHPSIKNPIVVHKFSKDFYQCIRTSLKTAEKIFSKHSKARKAMRHRGIGAPMEATPTYQQDVI